LQSARAGDKRASWRFEGTFDLLSLMVTLPARPSQSYWNRVAPGYDDIFPNTLIGQAQRKVVHEALDRVFQPGQRILELNCGTGIDAVHLAERGVRVLACDLSDQMIELARRRAHASQVGELADFRVLATEDIGHLGGLARFDGVFSNFSGLNLVMNLRAVAGNLAALLKPNARALFCLAGPFSPAETAWHLLHGNLGGALRRLTRRTDDPSLKVQYLSPMRLARTFAPEFRLQARTGIGVMLPSCVEPAARRFPTTFNRLAQVDHELGRVPGLRGLADCVLLEFERAGP
jgi:2-polyprenyl-3-methyl-5-hydroxy-6-metoxy-1,4-benzoquinol methylase